MKRFKFNLKILFFRITRIKLPPAEWQRIFNEIEILDPDGWDRSCERFLYDWHHKKISITEYMDKLLSCTVSLNPDILKGYEK